MKYATLVLLVWVMAMLAVTAFGAGFNRENDEQLILWLDFDSEDITDLSPRKTFLSTIVPGTIVEGLIDDAWQFEEGTEIGVGGAFSAPFDESTFSVWVLKSSESGILYDEGGGTNGLCVQVLNGQLQFCTRDNGAATCLQADFPTNDDKWHLVTAVFNSGVMELYIDDEMVGSQDDVPGIGQHANETGIGKVGAGIVGLACNPSAGQWTGIMDEACVTDRGVTAQEVKEEFEAGGEFSVEPVGKIAVTWGNVKKVYR